MKKTKLTFVEYIEKTSDADNAERQELAFIQGFGSGPVLTGSGSNIYGQTGSGSKSNL